MCKGQAAGISLSPGGRARTVAELVNLVVHARSGKCSRPNLERDGSFSFYTSLPCANNQTMHKQPIGELKRKAEIFEKQKGFVLLRILNALRD